MKGQVVMKRCEQTNGLRALHTPRCAVALLSTVCFPCPVFRLLGTCLPRRSRRRQARPARGDRGNVRPGERTRQGATWRKRGATLGQLRKED